MYFAHAGHDHAETTSRSLGSALSDSIVPVILVSVAVVALMIGTLWLLKRYYKWETKKPTSKDKVKK